MRKLLILSVALFLVAQGVGCRCCQSLVDCERRKNQWLRDHCCGIFHHNPPAALAPLVAAPALVPIYTAPPQQVIVAPSQPVAIAPPMDPQSYAAVPPVCAPVQVAPANVCPPVNVCPQVTVCPQVEQCCPQMMVDPCEQVCEPMWCP